MKNIVFISASPKASPESVSRGLNEKACSRIAINENKMMIDVRKSLTSKKTAEDFAAIAKADALIITFPLYFFCLPGMLMRYLEDFDRYRNENNIGKVPAKVYAMVNCGFTESEINLEAVRVIKSFAKHIDANFRFGILIGGGGMLLEAQTAPPVKKALLKLDEAFEAIEQDLQNAGNPPLENIEISFKFPKRLYHLMGGLGWISQARKNGLKKKDLYRKPYVATR